MRQFKVGDKVAWTSQAGGYTKTKRGKVVHVVPAHVMPPHALTPKGAGMARDHQSYIVEVTRPRSATLYWPRAAVLVAV